MQLQIDCLHRPECEDFYVTAPIPFPDCDPCPVISVYIYLNLYLTSDPS